MLRSNAWGSLVRAVLRLEPEKIQPWIACRNTIGIGLPLAAAVALGQPEAGLILATGALNVAFSDGSDPYLPRAWRMLAATFAGSFAVAAGALCGNHQGLAIAAPIIWAFGAGMLVAVDAAAADIGLITLVMLVVFAAQPMAPQHALLSGLLALAGGLLQTTLSVAAWPFRRFEPERRVLGALYREIARAAASPVVVTEAPPASHQATQAQQVLTGLWRSRTIQGERYLSLLNQAERLRLSILMLARLQTRFEREPEHAGIGTVLGKVRETTAGVLNAVADWLESGNAAGPHPGWLPVIEEAAEAVRPLVVAADAVHGIDALAGQLRAAIDLAASSTPSGRQAFERREEQQPWRLRLIGTIATVRANLTPRSTAFQHAVRLSVSVGIGEVLARTMNMGRTYWVPMTIAIVLKPDFTSTFSRGVLRLVGTYAGLFVATALFAAAVPSRAVEVVIVAVLAFILRCFGPANYGIFVAALSAYLVVLFAIAGIPPAEVIAERGWNTVIGGAIALIVYATWPTWERKYVPGAIARLLDAYRAYFRAVRDAYTQPGYEQDHALEVNRAEGRLARSNLQASIDRAASEPGVPAESLALANAILASSHRLVHSMMALEAGLLRSRPVPPRPAFHDYANGVELTLHSLAAALRGSDLPEGALPDLRELHRRLTHAGDPLSERYALVNVETDRMTNSLNTLAELVRKWTATVTPSQESLSGR